MKYLIALQLFADTYGCGTYGSGNFNDNQTCLTDGGGLAGTGTDIAIGIGVGVVLIAIALFLIFRNRTKK